jgi:hypothetical protein
LVGEQQVSKHNRVLDGLSSNKRQHLVDLYRDGRITFDAMMAASGVNQRRELLGLAPLLATDDLLNVNVGFKRQEWPARIWGNTDNVLTGVNHSQTLVVKKLLPTPYARPRDIFREEWNGREWVPKKIEFPPARGRSSRELAKALWTRLGYFQQRFWLENSGRVVLVSQRLYAEQAVIKEWHLQTSSGAPLHHEMFDRRFDAKLWALGLQVNPVEHPMVGALTDEIFRRARAEMQRARLKHPSTALMGHAITEEHGEFVQASIDTARQADSRDHALEEGVQLLAVAARVLIEGDDGMQAPYGFMTGTHNFHHNSRGRYAKEAVCSEFERSSPLNQGERK